jgi:hypothetical protein
MRRVVTKTRERLNSNDRRVVETVEEKAWCGCVEGSVRRVEVVS